MKFVSKSVNIGFGTVFLIGIICSIVNLYSMCNRYSETAFISICIVLILAIMILYCLNRFEKYLKNRKDFSMKLLTWLPLILLVFQIIFALTVDFIPKNDLSYVCKGAENFVKYGVDSICEGLPERHRHYFAVYPNNHMLFMIIALLYKITYAITGKFSNFLPTVVNIIGLNLAYVFMLKTAKLIYNPEKAVICGLRGFMFTPLITYATFFYTDSLSMFFVSAGIYYYIKSRREQNFKKSLKVLVLCGIIIAVGYQIKGSVIILLAAILFDLLLHKYSIKTVLIKAGTIITVFVILVSALNLIAFRLLGISKEERNKYEFPKIHWIMMSADGKGGYNSEDFMYTKSFDGYNNKIKADKERLIEKIKSQGIGGFTFHVLKKIGYTWGNGTYMAPYYNKHNKILNSIPFIGITEIVHFSILFKVLQSFIIKRKSYDDAVSETFFLKICLAGLFIFLIVWEARCRYLVSFFALFALI